MEQGHHQEPAVFGRELVCLDDVCHGRHDVEMGERDAYPIIMSADRRCPNSVGLDITLRLSRGTALNGDGKVWVRSHSHRTAEPGLQCEAPTRHLAL